MTKKYGLIGYPLGYSFSPKYFAKKFHRLQIDAEYQSYPILDRLDPVSEAISAVNTVKVVNGLLIGYNTDVYGFHQSLINMNLPFDCQGKGALILGTGGASKAVYYVLNELGMQVHHASRSAEGKSHTIAYENLAPGALEDYAIIVNTTPLGMQAYEQSLPPIAVHELNKHHLVYDLIYNPEKTVLLKKAEEKGALIKNGAEMLVLQAEKSWEIWNT